MRHEFFGPAPVQRVHVLDHVELGRVVARWALEPASRPGSLDELRRQLHGIAILPAGLRGFAFAAEAPETLTIGLPDPEAIRIEEDRVEDPFLPLHYPVPQCYADHFSPGLAPVLTPLDMFHARIGDRALSHFS